MINSVVDLNFHIIVSNSGNHAGLLEGHPDLEMSGPQIDILGMPWTESDPPKDRNEADEDRSTFHETKAQEMHYK